MLVVRTAARGDFSRYRFALVAAPGSDDPPSGFDPLLAEVPFSFKVECPSDFDCNSRMHVPARRAPPRRRSTTSPRTTRASAASCWSGWRCSRPAGRSARAADVGVTLVELMAYVADELSYRQDAVATEAYLGTAAARASRCAGTPASSTTGCTTAATRAPGCRSRVTRAGRHPAAGHHAAVPGAWPAAADRAGLAGPQTALDAHPVVFETVEEAVLHSDLNEMRFWTWGDLDCCLPAGATTATLRGHHPALRAGDVVVIAETVSPTTGKAAGCRIRDKRFAVRLVDVSAGDRPVGGAVPRRNHRRHRDPLARRRRAAGSAVPERRGA